MKNIQNKLILLLFIVLAFPYPGSSQDSLINEFTYEVNRIYPDNSITIEKLQEAHILIDLNRWYRPSWVREYFSVEILTSHKGKIISATSKNDTLSQEQKDIIKKANFGSDISVKVKYIPENNLKQNDPKEFNFTFTVDPESEAKYPGGQQQLEQYLKDNIVDKISEAKFKEYQLAAVKFTIDEDGHIIDPHLFWTSEDEETDKILLDAICNMPGWKPAEYSNGIKVKQEFVLSVGDMRSCVVNLLDIRRNKLVAE